MRRYRSLRFDLWVCLLVAYLAAVGIGKAADLILPQAYENYKQEHTVNIGEIGGKAMEDEFRAQNIDDLLSHETFTVVSPGIEYRNRGAGYHDSKYLYVLTLPSQEKVAAYINMDAVQYGEDLFTGDSILPVGRVVYEDLSEDESFLNQIEFKEKLTRNDFYIDMMGEGERVSESSYSEMSKALFQIPVGIAVFALCHYLGSKLGIFPAFFSLKKKNQSEWN